MREYVGSELIPTAYRIPWQNEYYHDDRIHDGLKKETPTLRAVGRRPKRDRQGRGNAPRRRIASSLSMANRRLKGWLC